MSAQVNGKSIAAYTTVQASTSTATVSPITPQPQISTSGIVMADYHADHGYARQRSVAVLYIVHYAHVTHMQQGWKKPRFL